MSFLTYWLNTYKGKYVSIVTDPRQYSKMPRDFVHWADINLSQIDKDMQFTENYTQYWPAGQIIENPQRLHKNIRFDQCLSHYKWNSTVWILICLKS